MKIKLIKILCFISIGLLISSCDKEHIKEYYIRNDSVEEIKVKFKVDEIIDSISVQPSETNLFYTHLYYFGTVGVNDDRLEDKISDLKIQKDSIYMEIDESLWEYEEVGKYYAKYTMVFD